MQFRKRDVALEQIASRLNVANVLDGSVRKIGDRVRIVPQLVEVATGRNLWAETYDRRLTDIFEIQTDVALQIAAALEAELSPKERERINRGPTLNIDAYEEYLRGRRCFLRYTPEAMLESIEYFDRAFVRSRFSLAHMGLKSASASWWRLAHTTASSPRRRRSRAEPRRWRSTPSGARRTAHWPTHACSSSSTGKAPKRASSAPSS
jgi:adenylate cyclase